MQTKVLIVEDKPEIMRRCLDAVLAEPVLSLHAAVGTGRAGLAMLDLQAPDVLLVDLALPDMGGMALVAHAVGRHPACEILVVAVFPVDDQASASMQAATGGCSPTDAPAGRIVASIQEFRTGAVPRVPSPARRMLERFDAQSLMDARSVPRAGPQRSPLTPRENELLRMIAKGFTFETIGTLLDISPHTVVAHVKKIYRKLAVHSRSEAVYEAGQLGLL